VLLFFILVLPVHCFVFIMYFYRFAMNKVAYSASRQQRRPCSKKEEKASSASATMAALAM